MIVLALAFSVFAVIALVWAIRMQRQIDSLRAFMRDLRVQVRDENGLVICDLSSTQIVHLRCMIGGAA